MKLLKTIGKCFALLLLIASCKNDCDCDRLKVQENSVWKYDALGIVIELTCYPSKNKIEIKSTPEDVSELGEPYHTLGGNRIYDYCMKGNKMYIPWGDGDHFDFDYHFDFDPEWIISFPSENQMEMLYGGKMPGIYVLRYLFKKIN